MDKRDHRRFYVKMHKNLTVRVSEPGSRLPGEVVKSTLERCQTHLDTVIVGNML